MVKGDMLVYLARWNWMLGSFLTFIIGRTTLAGYVPTLNRTRKSQKKLNNLKGCKERTTRTITN